MPQWQLLLPCPGSIRLSGLRLRYFAPPAASDLSHAHDGLDALLRIRSAWFNQPAMGSPPICSVQSAIQLRPLADLPRCPRSFTGMPMLCSSFLGQLALPYACARHSFSLAVIDILARPLLCCSAIFGLLISCTSTCWPPMASYCRQLSARLALDRQYRLTSIFSGTIAVSVAAPIRPDINLAWPPNLRYPRPRCPTSCRSSSCSWRHRHHPGRPHPSPSDHSAINGRDCSNLGPGQLHRRPWTCPLSRRLAFRQSAHSRLLRSTSPRSCCC